MQGVKAAVAVVAVAVLVVLEMAQGSSFQKSSPERHPLIKKINEQNVSYIGLILETTSNEKALLESGLFVPASPNPTVNIKGRIFNIGQLDGVDIIYIKTLGGVISTTSYTQLLLDLFNIKGIVHYATAGSVNDSLAIGDVVVPNQAAYYANVIWQSWRYKKSNIKFGDYNWPNPGENSLGGFTFLPTKVFNASGVAKNIFWLPIESAWSDVADQIQVELEQCLSPKKCLPRPPEIVHGLRLGTADVYMNNAAMREFIYTQFKISAVDTTTASVVWAAVVNDLPVVVFKGLSNTAGGSTDYRSYSYLGSLNAFKAAAAFVAEIGKPTSRIMKNTS